MKIINTVALILSLTTAACGAEPQDVGNTSSAVKTANTDVVKPNRTSPRIIRQRDQLRYTRYGTWQPVRTRFGVALMARDTQGDRLLVLRRSSGYDIYQLRAGCDRKGAWGTTAGRGSDTDAGMPSAKSGPAGDLDLSAEMRRVCAQTERTGQALEIRAAVGKLRKAAEAKPERTEMTDADRAAAMEAMRRYRASKPK